MDGRFKVLYFPPKFSEPLGEDPGEIERRWRRIAREQFWADVAIERRRRRDSLFWAAVALACVGILITIVVFEALK